MPRLNPWTVLVAKASQARWMIRRDPVAGDRLLLLVVGSYGISLVVLLALAGHSPGEALRWTALNTLPTAAVTVLGGAVLFYLVCLVAVRRPASPFATLRRDIAFVIANPQRSLPIAWLLLLMVFFTAFFSAWKAMIPQLQPFAWDPAFSQMDRWLHGGTHPWRYTHAVFSSALATSIINLIYHLWFVVIHFSVIWVAVSRGHSQLRLQYLLSFFLAWIIVGTILAIAFSSAGPCYFERVTGLASPYADLMQRLELQQLRYPVWALGVQELLWANHVRGANGMTSGISAMPSMHVGTCVLLVLLACRLGSRRAVVCATFFLFCILVGSVHLGWHYAVDGYAAGLIMLPIWWIAGKVTRHRLDSLHGETMNQDKR
ncbi:phosphatase PAP2 family protein [Algiphilus sp.]|uniref:phosphatase PAP2 family protein n=1 Tax=Algiphilus sp. TaxID=1872431 RepID=UPI003B51EA7A